MSPLEQRSAAWRRLPWVPDRRPIWEWAGDHLKLPPVLTRSGAFDWRDSRHFLKPLEWLQADLVREVNVCAPVRSGKTLLADVLVPWLVVNDPASILWVFNVDPTADLHCETRLNPILRSCSGVRALLPTNRHQARTTQIQFANGLPLHCSGPAMSNLQSRGYRVVIGDEIWEWPEGRLIEAKARMGDFVRMANNKFFGLSQGGAEGDQWHEQFCSGELWEWQVPCAHCGHRQPAWWTGKRADGTRWGILYDAKERPDGSYDFDHAAASARFACRACGHEHPDAPQTRARWNLHGDYARTGELVATRKSATWTALIDYPWGELVVEWLRARRSAHQGFYLPTIQFFQKRLAQWATEGTIQEKVNPVEPIEWTPTAGDWPEEAGRYTTVDCQADDLHYVMVRAWAKSGESRRLFWGEAYGASEVAAICQRFNVPAARTLVDVGYQGGSNDVLERKVYRDVAANGWLGVKGVGTANQFLHQVVERGQPKTVVKLWSTQYFGDPDRGDTAQGVRKAGFARCLRWAVNPIADRTQGLMESGHWKEPPLREGDDAEAEYRAQLRSEIKVAEIDSKTGRRKRYWRKIRTDNHALDCARMQTLAAMLGGIL